MRGRLSLSTDYAHYNNPVRECLSRTAEAGFGMVHWCQHWNDDYLYTVSEITTIRSWLKEDGLRCADLHATAGSEKDWGSPDEYSRRAGLDLIQNRMEMTAELGGDAIVLHPSMVFVGHKYDDRKTFHPDKVKAMRKTLPHLVRLSERTGVRIALENMPFTDRISDLISSFLKETPADRVGICYDAGHGHIIKGSLSWLERWKNRLYVVHLHDNLGRKDQHLLPFEGTVDWSPLVSVLRTSPYWLKERKPLTLELWRWTRPKMSEKNFLKAAFAAGEKLQDMMSSG